MTATLIPVFNVSTGYLFVSAVEYLPVELFDQEASEVIGVSFTSKPEAAYEFPTSAAAELVDTFLSTNCGLFCVISTYTVETGEY